MNRKVKIQSLNGNSPEAGNCKLQVTRAPTGAQKGRNPESRTTREVTVPLAEGSSRYPRGQGRSGPAAHSSARHSPMRGGPTPGRILIGLVFQDGMHVHCAITGTLVCPLNSGLLDRSPAHSHSESSFVDPLTLPGHSGSTPTWEW